MVCTVSGNIVDISGDLKPGAVITFSRPRVYGQDGQVVVNGTVTATADSAGFLSVDLQPGNYRCTYSASGADGIFTIGVPDAPSVPLAGLIGAAEVSMASEIVASAQASANSAAASSAAAGAASGRLDVGSFAELSTKFNYTGTGGRQLAAAGDIILWREMGFAYEVLASGASGARLDYTGSGGVKLSLLPGVNGRYNPLAIGVDNTGVANASALIDALDAVGPLSFSPGTYLIDQTISQSRSWIATDGVTLKLKDNAVFAGGAIEVVSPFVSCTGFKVDGNRTGGAQAQQIWYSDQVGTVFDNLNVTGVWKDAIQFWGDYSRAFQCRVEFDADSGQSGIEGIAGVNSDYSTIDSCIILNGVDDCISFHVANGCAMTNNYCHNLYGKGACVGLAGKCFDINISNNICIAEGTGATGASMIRVATEDSAAFANVANGLRINTRDNNLFLVSGATRDYGIRYQGNGSSSQITGNTIKSDGTMLIGIEVLEHTVAATLYTPTEVGVIGNTVDGAATGIKAITATGSKIEGNTIKNATLGIWSQVVGSLDDSNHFLSCTTPFNIGGNGRVFSAWESERFCNLARPATGSIDLALNPGGTIRTKTAQGRICIIGMTAQVSALPSANNLNAILYADVGSGLATVTGATIQFNSGTAAWIQDFVAASYPAIVDAGDTFKVETTTSGSITVTPEMIVDVHYVQVRAA